jgi:hypothetical protein
LGGKPPDKVPSSAVDNGVPAISCDVAGISFWTSVRPGRIIVNPDHRQHCE